jgi:hypothetical protein
MIHRDMVPGDLFPTRSGATFVCDLPGPGPWHMCRIGNAAVVVSPNWPKMAVIRDGVPEWIDPVGEIQA